LGKEDTAPTEAEQIRALSKEFADRALISSDGQTITLPVHVVKAGDTPDNRFVASKRGSRWIVQGYGSFCADCCLDVPITGDIDKDKAKVSGQVARWYFNRPVKPVRRHVDDMALRDARLA